MRRFNLLQSIIIVVLVIGYCILLCEAAKGQELRKVSLYSYTKEINLVNAVEKIVEQDITQQDFYDYMNYFVEMLQENGYEIKKFYPHTNVNEYQNYLFYEFWVDENNIIVNIETYNDTTTKASYGN